MNLKVIPFNYHIESIICISLLFLISNSFAQNYVTSLAFNMKKGGKSFSYVDKSTNETYLFISNSKKIKAVHYAANFDVLDTLTTLIPNNKINNMIGFTKKNSTANLVWMSDNSTQLCFQNLDFKNKVTTNSVQSISFKNENFLQAYSTNDAFYCLSIVDGSSVLKLYVFDNKNELQIKTFDFSDKVFFNSNAQRVALSGLFSESFDSYESASELQNIDNSIPTSLTTAAKKRKSYLSKEELILTFDNNIQATQLIRLNLKNYTASSESIKNSAANASIVQSNSFVFENNLYQFQISSSKLFFSIKDFNGKSIKEFEANSNENISFKGSDFIFQQVNPDKNKIENTSQFLNTLGKYKIGITCYQYKNDTIISFGGVSGKIRKIFDEEDGSGRTYVMVSNGLIGAAFYTVAFNYFYDSFGSSRNLLSINTVFSKDLELKNEKVNNCITNKICSYFNSSSLYKYPTVFALNGKAYIGHYQDESKQFVVFKFEN